MVLALIVRDLGLNPGWIQTFQLIGLVKKFGDHKQDIYIYIFVTMH